MEYVLNIIGVPHYGIQRALAPLKGFLLHLRDHFIPHARNNYHPHILGHRALALFSSLLVAVKISVIALLAFGPIAPAFSSAITIDNIISLTNQSRHEYSLGTLSENSLLDQAAQKKADDMLAKGYFSHNTPDGRTPWSFITGAGYNYLMAGENLAVNFTQAENVETAWMNSPGHKANILNKNFEQIGIGISQGEYQGHSAIFVVQMFGVPTEQRVKLSEAPTKVQAQAIPEPVLAHVEPVKNQKPGAPQTLAVHETKIIEPVNIVSGEVKLLGDQVQINSKVSGPAVKVLAYFGEQAIMLSPKGGEEWEGSVSISSLAKSNTTVRLKAFDNTDKISELQLADFSSSTVQNFNLGSESPAPIATVLGHKFNPTAFEKNFYLFFISAILASLILAIAIKRHIQHLSLIANTSFAAIFAILLWWH